MNEAGRRNAGRRIGLFYDLGFAPWRMGLRGLRLWLWAEVDGARLRLRQLFGLRRREGSPAPVRMPTLSSGLSCSSRSRA